MIADVSAAELAENGMQGGRKPEKRIQKRGDATGTAGSATRHGGKGREWQ